jgi:DNA-binding transcriptional regulator YiaG
MSNVLKELKAEIVRLARKEIKKELTPARKATVTQRGLIADLRRQVNALQKELGALKRVVPTQSSAVLSKDEPEGRFWITGRGVKALRKRLGLTQKEFGQLAGVSSQAVVKWEANKGKIGLRKSPAAKLQGMRNMGKREVTEILGKGKKK